MTPDLLPGDQPRSFPIIDSGGIYSDSQKQQHMPPEVQIIVRLQLYV